MSDTKPGYAVLQPQEQSWRESNMMKLPNTNLLGQLGGSPSLTGRLWRLPAYSAST